MELMRFRQVFGSWRDDQDQAMLDSSPRRELRIPECAVVTGG